MSLHDNHSTLKQEIYLSDLKNPLEVCARYSRSIQREKDKHSAIENHRNSLEATHWLLTAK